MPSAADTAEGIFCIALLGYLRLVMGDVKLAVKKMIFVG
jgi:hypothetical protein